MSEEENIAQELHGHLTQMLRTSMSGGLQMTEQRARRRQHDAEAERRTLTDAARQLEERKRIAGEASALLAHQTLAGQEQERAADARREADAADRFAAEHATAAFPIPIGQALADVHQHGTGPDVDPVHEPEHATSMQPAGFER